MVVDAVTLKAAGQAARSCIPWAIAKIKKIWSYILRYNNNMNDIRSRHHDLEMLKKEIELRVLAGERKLETIVPLVDDCLKDAEAFLADDEWSDFTDENKIGEKDQCCFSLVQMNLKYRYLISKRAVKKSETTKEKITKMKDCSSRAVTLPDEPPKLGSMPTAYSKSLASRESILKEIMEALKDKEVRVIGIYGMGGVGKTTLIEEVARRAEANGLLFSEVVIVEVSQAPNVLKMQQQIAERIGLPLHNSESANERARKIHKRLENKILKEEGDQMLKKVGKQVLVILDNIWNKLDLDRVGIPHHCKITLTTRSEHVCHEMGANKTFEVRGLDDTEAMKLFLERARNPADHDDAYKSVTSELVKKCGGLPLAIAALADASRDRDLSDWKRVTAQLERPISAIVGRAIEEKVFPVLEWSYNFISGDEKKKFFLLCCLFPLGSSIAVQDLMRYGAGLGLFQHKNSLEEAIEQANSWASELKSSSLLLEAEDEQHVKIQDVVRVASMSIAAKGRNVFQFGSFPKLLMKETFRTYTAISMTNGHNHEPLSRFKFPKLEMLLLKGSQPFDEFSDNFFQGMKNLKVLVMSDMQFLTLPSSITQLKNLRTLHLEHCELFDISAIVELVDLLFLSLRESTIAELPTNFENLVHLKLLDLTQCSELRKIRAGVITRLIELEELYLMGSFVNEGLDNEEKGANLIELNSLSNLAVLEMHVPSINLLPDNLLFPHLSRFQISMGSQALNNFFASSDYYQLNLQWESNSRILLLENIDGSMLLNQSINCLLQETECLILEKIKGLTSVTDSLLNDRFRNLKCLFIKYCDDMEYIASTNEQNEEGVFPKLEELVFFGMGKMKGIYHGPDLYDDFSHLKNLYLDNIEFDGSFWDDDDGVQDDKPFFNKEMKFSSLEELTIKNVHGIVELWHLADVEEEVPAFPKLVHLKLDELPELRSIWRSKDVIIHRSFQNLKNLFVGNCPNLEMLCPLSVATAIEQLDFLHVFNNKKMKEIIAKETEKMKNNDTEMIIFPKLQDMLLSNLPSLKYFFEGNIKLVFPSLKQIYCNDLEKMVAFISSEYPENSNALFNDKVVMPAIKNIYISEMHGQQEIWDSHLDATSFNELETINISSVEKVMKVFSLDAIKQMHNLKELNLQEFQSAKEFAEFVEFYNDEVENLALLPQLKNLVMDSFPQLKRISWGELALENLCKLEISKIHGLTSLFPASVCGRFVNLEALSIIDCEKMEEIVEKKSWDTNIVEIKVVFPHLNFLRLNNLPAFRNLGSNNVILEFSSVEGVDFAEFQNPILLDLLQKFQHVKKLELGGCEALSELSNLKGPANPIPSRLRKFTLYNMSNSHRIPWTVFSVKSIHYLKISKVQGLKFLFPASMYSEGFVQLEEIHIDGCKDLEQVSIEDSSNNATSTTIVLPHVKIINLQDLPSLRSFNSENYHTLKFPSLEEVEIRRCPVMETFSCGSISTPRLCKINIDWKNEKVCFDLNAIIQKRRKGKMVEEDAEKKFIEEETSGEEGEMSREGAKGKFVEGETSREGTKKGKMREEAAEKKIVEEETSGEEEEMSREGATGEFVKGETSGEGTTGEFVEGETSREDVKEESVEGETSGEVTEA